MKRLMKGVAGAMILLLSLNLLGGPAQALFEGRQHTVTFEPSGKAMGNPLMGYAPCAWYQEIPDDVTLLYMDITWRELEPEEGVYDWEAIEAENQLARWRSEGRHMVLRFVCDIPGDEDHLDIPDWLYEKTDGAGTHYRISSGRGFSPDYANPVFVQAHRRAIEALGQRYGQDGFIAYVQLGSLGHWGEWHVSYADGIERLPLESVREEYVQAWADAFPHAHLLMRRPFSHAARHGFGLYNDMSGHPEATLEWLNWIEYGGRYSQTNEPDAVVPMPESWKTAPIGGELTSSLDMDELLDGELDRTAHLIRLSHTTFLGPKTADPDCEDGYETLLENMGYRLRISECTLRFSLFGCARVTLTWHNDGAAPFYWDWPVQLYVMQPDGTVLETVPVDMQLSHLLPAQTLRTSTHLDILRRWRDLDGLVIGLGIVDPMTGQNAVSFAVKDAQTLNGSLVLAVD